MMLDWPPHTSQLAEGDYIIAMQWWGTHGQISISDATCNRLTKLFGSEDVLAQVVCQSGMG